MPEHQRWCRLKNARRSDRKAQRRGTWVAGLALLLAGCGSAAVAATSGREASAAKVVFATTPTSPGIVNPAAIPLGDGYVSTKPKVGYVDSCVTQFPSMGGASVVGPWINTARKTWDSLTKVVVGGRVSWPDARYKMTVRRGRRIIDFNDLPIDHASGVFPIQPGTAAYRYDHNPNHLIAQKFDWSLPLDPKPAVHPSCTSGGPIGVLDDGVALFNALDGEGRDAGAHEVLDACAGHPMQDGIYHHHEVPPCVLDKVRDGQTKLVGYALDGYGIYVVKNRRGQLPGNASLDACHGSISKVMWNGKLTRIFHYVATLEYPYTVGCFHGTPISSEVSMGMGGGGPGAP
jgi:hypothetical protein